MKKLIFVTLALGYGIGGSEKALIQMLKEIDLSSYEVTVLSLLEAPENPFVREGIKVIYGHKDFLHMSMPFKKMLCNFNKYSLGALGAKIKTLIASRIRKFDFSDIMWKSYKPYIGMLEEKYDVAIGYGVNTALFFATDKIVAEKKVMWVNTDLKKAHINLKFAEKYYQKSDCIVVDSESGISRFLEIYPQYDGKVYAIRNILDIEELISKSKDGDGFIDEYDGYRILSVGRFVEAKAFHYAIEAASILKQKKFKFKWYFIGFGGLEKSLKELANNLNVDDSIVFLGQKTNPYPFFAQTDFYVQTSIFEGSCITLEEAMVFCKPIVTTNFPAAFEKIIDGKNGFITEMNGQSVAEAVEKLLGNKELALSMQNYQKENPLSYSAEIDKFYSIVE